MLVMSKMNLTMMTRTYSELRKFKDFEGRLEYLKLDGRVGQATFGFDRYINQNFYMSHQWKSVRDEIIVRDRGCDLGVRGYEINAELLVHHMNPMVAEDIINGEEWILDPEYLITTTTRTHNDIHFGYGHSYPMTVITRTPNDTKLW